MGQIIRPPLEGWVSGSQAAAVLGVTASRVGQMRREHQLGAERTGIGYLYWLADVAELAATRARHPAAAGQSA